MITFSKANIQSKTKRLTFGLAALVSGAILLSVAQPAAAAPNADGDLDTSFGGTGKVTTSFAIFAAARAVAIQSNGKVVVAGYEADFSGSGLSHDFVVARYNTNGSLDTSFDGDGKVSTDFNGDDYAYGVAIQQDGKIVVVGSSTDEVYPVSDFAVARYNTNGSPDTNFSGDGKALYSHLGLGDAAYAVAIQSNGKIVVAGASKTNYGNDFALLRLNTDGTADTNFSGDGIQTTDFGGEESGAAVAIQPDGKIVVGGKATVAGAQDFALARYNSNGTLDYSFDTDGRVTTDISIGAADSVQSLALAPDGKIVAAGTYALSDDGGAFALARYQVDGVLDTSFDGDGRVTTSFGGPANGRAVVIQSDGKIVAAGYVDTGATKTDFALARYTSNGALDNSFSGDGRVFTDFGGPEDQAYGLALQSDGKLVAAGLSGAKLALARYQYAPAATATPTNTATSTSTSTPVPPKATSVPGGATATPTGGAGSAPTSCPIQFSDVPQGSTFYSYIKCLACRSVLNGYQDGTFKPGNTTTRGQLSKIVSNAAGFTETYSTQSFEDVPVGSTFHQFIERMYARGIVSGYQCGEAGEPCVGPTKRPYFRPGANTTRGQIAKIVATANGMTATPSGQSFEDVPVGSTFYLYIERIAAQGTISGYQCGEAGEPCVGPTNRPYFRPQNNATRGQIAKIVSNTFFPNCQTP